MTAPTTQSVTTMAVDANGNPIIGYHEAPNETSYTTLDTCTAPAGRSRSTSVTFP
jgi:hypothetical protein